MKYLGVLLLLGSLNAFAQGFSSGIPLPGLPISRGAKLMAGSTSVTIATDQTALPVIVSGDIKETRFHDAALVNINGSAGAWVALGSGAAITVTVKQIQFSSTIGDPLEIGVGSAAGNAVQKFIINQGGGPVVIADTQASGDKLWIRSLSSSATTSGYLTLNLVGP
jgi:hypothetical protein